MKLVVRIFALSVVLAGVAASHVSPASVQQVAVRHNAAMPVPFCAPGLPTCPDDDGMMLPK
jgi:hypothetical protein